MQNDRNARDHLVTGERCQHEDVECNDTIDHFSTPSTDLRVASCLISPSCVRTAPANTSSFQSTTSSPFGSAGFRKLNRLREYISLAWYGSVAGRLTGPRTFTPPCSTVSPARVSSQLPPCSAAISTTTEPGLMRSTAEREMILGAGRPGTDAVVTTASAAAILESSTSCCLRFSSSVSSRA